ncbi:MAG: ATP-dependent zinc metalloprotease FtsH [Patescibacteria group bacterium]
MATKQSEQQPQSKKPLRVKQMKVNLDFTPRRMIIWLIIGLLFVPFIISMLTSQNPNATPLSQVIADVKDQKIEKIMVTGDSLEIKYTDASQKISQKEPGQNIYDVFSKAEVPLDGVEVTVKDQSMSQILWELALQLVFPVILVFVLGFFILRQAKGAQDGILGFGKSKAKIFVKGKQDTKFADVGGMDEAKKELEEIVDFLKNPKQYQKLGARTPKGVLLVGPSGTGKTLLARAVAGEANVQFLSMAGSEFMEMLVGVGASRVRDLFDTAKKLAPSIIFIDEIDAIGRMRGHGSMGGHDEREQTLNQILVEMDGFTTNDNVMVMAATNRGDLLDPALVRPGRFDRRVMVSLPDLEERKYILSIHAKGKPFEDDVKWERVAKRTVGFSGADLENMLNEAAIAVAREKREKIAFTDIEEAALKVKLGPSKRRLKDRNEREMTAYHEAGHAVIAHVLPNADPVHRISIVSRGMALGYTLTPPEQDKLQQTKSELEDNIAVMLGGRAAEQLIFNELTGGASSDIERATRIARAMVFELGMSKLGPVNMVPEYGDNYSRAMGEPYVISERFKQEADGEVSRIIDEQVQRVKLLLKKYKKSLDVISKKLVEVETLDADEFSALMGVDKAKN